MRNKSNASEYLALAGFGVSVAGLVAVGYLVYRTRRTEMQRKAQLAQWKAHREERQKEKAKDPVVVAAPPNGIFSPGMLAAAKDFGVGKIYLMQ